MSGPLQGLQVVELAGLGAAPLCGMILADLGAEVVRVDRIEQSDGLPRPQDDLLNRGKRSIAVDTRDDRGVEIVLAQVERSDVLIEGFRPGVTERLGLGPDVCLGRSPALVYGRLTGWGQDGPLASTAGHDINYIALSGVLGSIGPPEDPVVPLNLVGDFGGGGMLLALGVVSAVLNARQTGTGQVVDASMVDGSALLMTSHHGYRAGGWWSSERGANVLDGSAPFYTTYRTADGGHMAVGALEPRFYQALLEGLGLDESSLPVQHDREGWPEIRKAFASRFASKTRDEWAEVFAGSDACVTPVLSMADAAHHAHNRHRHTFVDVGGVTQPAPAPRFALTPPTVRSRPPVPGEHTDEILTSLGYNPDDIGMLRGTGTVS